MSVDNKYRVSTGIRDLDGIIGGGVPVNRITFVRGREMTGRSSLIGEIASHIGVPSVLVMVDTPGERYADGGGLVVTDGTASIEEISEIAVTSERRVVIIDRVLPTMGLTGFGHLLSEDMSEQASSKGITFIVGVNQDDSNVLREFYASLILETGGDWYTTVRKAPCGATGGRIRTPGSWGIGGTSKW